MFWGVEFIAVLVTDRALEEVRAGDCGDARKSESLDELDGTGIARIDLGGDPADLIILEQVGEHARASLPRIALPPEWHKDHVCQQGCLVRTHSRLDRADVCPDFTLAQRPVQPDFLPIR